MVLDVHITEAVFSHDRLGARLPCSLSSRSRRAGIFWATRNRGGQRAIPTPADHRSAERQCAWHEPGEPQLSPERRSARNDVSPEGIWNTSMANQLSRPGRRTTPIRRSSTGRTTPSLPHARELIQGAGAAEPEWSWLASITLRRWTAVGERSDRPEVPGPPTRGTFGVPRECGRSRCGPPMPSGSPSLGPP